jgi:4-hydroxybenzoate polyprenyltransferase
MTTVTQQRVPQGYPSTLKYVFLSMRPEQWIKNFLVFAALVFSKNIFILSQDIKAFVGLIIFCMITGCSYMINDLVDLEKDRLHPTKSQRPLVSGKIKKPQR